MPEKADQSKFLEYIKKPFKAVPAFREAWKEAKEHKDKSFFEKVKIFFETFKAEMRGIEKEKKKVTKETKEKVQKTYKEVMSSSMESVNLDKNIDDSDRKFYEETFATAVASIEEMDETNQTHAYSAVEKLRDASKANPEKLEFEEFRALGAVSFIIFKKLKERYPDKNKFKSALKRFSKISQKSDYPLESILSTSTLKIFKIVEKPKGFFDAVSDFSSYTELSEFVGSLGIKTSDLSTLANLASSPLKNSKEIAEILKKSLFPHTNVGNLMKVAEILNRMIVKKVKKVDIDTLGDLVFLIDNKDFDHFADVLKN